MLFISHLNLFTAKRIRKDKSSGVSKKKKKLKYSAENSPNKDAADQ